MIAKTPKWSISWIVFSMLVVPVVALATSAQAATYVVNSTADPGDGVCDATCTLRDEFTT